MDEKTILKQADNVTYELVAGEAILIETNTGAYFSLNDTGTIFWEALDGRTPLGRIASQIAQTYNEKATSFVGELSVLAGTAADDDPAIVQEHLASLAAAYGVEVEVAARYLEDLQSGDRPEAAEEIIAALGVDKELVLADLIELAEELLAENLLTVVA